MSFSIVQGDKSPDLVLVVSIKGVVQDLTTGFSGGFTMRWKKPDGTVVENVALAVLDGPTGKLIYTWQTGDTDVPGWHHATVTGVRDNGDLQTFPSEGAGTWHVSPKLA